MIFQKKKIKKNFVYKLVASDCMHSDNRKCDPSRARRHRRNVVSQLFFFSPRDELPSYRIGRKLSPSVDELCEHDGKTSIPGI